jgi:hypothetical protein
MIRISESDKIFNINAFLNLIFIPYLTDNLGLKSGDLEGNFEYIVSKLSDDDFVNAFDASNVIARLNLVSNGGLQYNDGEKDYFSGLNDSIAIYYNNNIELYSEEKLGIEFETVDPSPYPTLPTIKDSIPNAFVGVKDFSKWYFTGNGKALYDYLSQYLTKDEIKELSDVCDEDINKNRFDDLMKMVGNEKYLIKQEEIVEVIEDKPTLSEQRIDLLNQKKEALSFREQLEELNLDVIKSKKTL